MKYPPFFWLLKFFAYLADAPLHVVGLSGGKDSTGMALHLVELHPYRHWEFICNATGNELPVMFEHWRKLERLLDHAIRPVRYHTDLAGLIREQKMLPNFRMRFCTRMLKIEPTIAYFESLPDKSVLYVGLRADEELRRGLYGEDISVCFPLREWGWGIEVLKAYLVNRGVAIPDRTDCAWCPYQKLGEWFDLWKNHPDLWEEGAVLERERGHTFRSAQRDTWPASMDDLAKEFASGRPLRNTARSTTCRVCSL